PDFKLRHYRPSAAWHTARGTRVVSQFQKGASSQWRMWLRWSIPGRKRSAAIRWWAGINWLSWPTFVAIAVVLVLLVGVTALLSFQRRPVNFGFGPEWKCYQTIMRGPVCFRD